MSTVVYVQRRPEPAPAPDAVIALQYTGEDQAFGDFMDAAVMHYYYGPMLPIGPSRTYQAAVVGNYYYAPDQPGEAGNERYLLMLTPAEWAEQFEPLSFVGQVQPSI